MCMLPLLLKPPHRCWHCLQDERALRQLTGAMQAELAAAENIVVVGSAARGPFMPTYTKQVRAALPLDWHAPGPLAARYCSPLTPISHLTCPLYSPGWAALRLAAVHALD